MSTSKTQCLTPFFKIYKGMKVVIMKNLYPRPRIVNISIEYIENVSLIYLNGYKKMLQCIHP
jgi:hypothetical protein